MTQDLYLLNKPSDPPLAIAMPVFGYASAVVIFRYIVPSYATPPNAHSVSRIPATQK